MPSRRRAWSSTESTRIIVSSGLSSEKPQTRTGRRFTVGNRSRDSQFDLRAGSVGAPDTQFRANLAGAFPHSRQPVMAGAALFQDSGRNALTIVPNSHPQHPFPIGDLRFDAVSPGMAEGIAQRLAHDAVNLVAHDRMQLARRAFHYKAESRAIVVGKLIPQF